MPQYTFQDTDTKQVAKEQLNNNFSELFTNFSELTGAVTAATAAAGSAAGSATAAAASAATLGSAAITAQWGHVTGSLSAQADLVAALGNAAISAQWGHVSGLLSAQADLVAALAGKEPSLGNPSFAGYLLSKSTDGIVTWVAPASGGSSFDPTNPGPIGATPDTGKFTEITVENGASPTFARIHHYLSGDDSESLYAGWSDYWGQFILAVDKSGTGQIQTLNLFGADVVLTPISGVARVFGTDFELSYNSTPTGLSIYCAKVDAFNYSRLKISTSGGYATIAIEEMSSGLGLLAGIVVASPIQFNAGIAIGPVTIDSTLGYISTPGGITAGQLITGSGFAVGSSPGITASGSFSNFTIVGGIITNAV